MGSQNDPVASAATHEESDASGSKPPLSKRQREILEFIQNTVAERGYPPSVREIGTAVGLLSPSTVHTHLNSLVRHGYLSRDATKPRAIEVQTDSSGAAFERRPVRHVPLLGDVAAGTGVIAQENVEEIMPLPADLGLGQLGDRDDLTGDGELFMLRVRGESMIEAGIFDGDLVVARRQQHAENGDIVVAGINEGEATVKRFRRLRNRVHLEPANPALSVMIFEPFEVTIYGRVVTVLRKL